MPPRDKSRSNGSMLQMKRCNDNIPVRMAETPLFANLPEAERKEMATELNVRIRSYEQEEIIAYECDPADEVITILNGCASVYESELREDRRHLAYRLVAGETYGAAFPALELKASPGMVMANEPTEVLLCKASRIHDVLKRGTHAAFVANLYAASARQSHRVWCKLSLVSCYEIADRILLYLRGRQEDGRSTAKESGIAGLAEYLCVNRTALYRAIDKLKRQKRITVVDGKIKLAPPC